MEDIWRDTFKAHSGKKTFPCNQCPKAFSDGGSLKTHLRPHSVEKTFQCNQYHKAFPDEMQFKIQIKHTQGKNHFLVVSVLKLFHEKVIWRHT